MSGVPLETCWAFNKLWNCKFYYKAASCWYFYGVRFWSSWRILSRNKLQLGKWVMKYVHFPAIKVLYKCQIIYSFFPQFDSWNPDVRRLPVAFHLLSPSFIRTDPTIYPSRPLKLSAVANTSAVEWCRYLWLSTGNLRLHVSNSHYKQPNPVTRSYRQKRH
jgi:hypothetical protein